MLKEQAAMARMEVDIARMEVDMAKQATPLEVATLRAEHAKLQDYVLALEASWADWEQQVDKGNENMKQEAAGQAKELCLPKMPPRPQRAAAAASPEKSIQPESSRHL